ncbi:MAG: Yip1 family protein [Ruegeria sp.]
MSSATLMNMVVLTVSNPSEAARQLLALKLSREALWVALALAVVLNAFLHVLSNTLFPFPDSDLQELTDSLVVYLAIVGGGLVISIAAFYQVGRKMGGTGSFNDIMTVMIWLQFLRVLAQALTMVLLMVMPVLVAILAIGAFLLGLYITVHFIDQAHRFGSPLKALGVLVLSALAIAVIISVLLSLFGGPMLGIPANV